MLGHEGFSGNGFSESGTKISNGEVVDINASMLTQAQITGTIFTKLSRIGSILLTLAKTGKILPKKSSTLSVKRKHDIS